MVHTTFLMLQCTRKSICTYYIIFFKLIIIIYLHLEYRTSLKMCRILCHFKLFCHFAFFSNCKFSKNIGCGTWILMFLPGKSMCAYNIEHETSKWLCKRVCHVRFCKKISFSNINSTCDYISPNQPLQVLPKCNLSILVDILYTRAVN